MKCPKCKKEITEVFVVSEFTQVGVLEGNKITEYNNELDSPVGQTIRVLCNECQEDITKHIKEI